MRIFCFLAIVLSWWLHPVVLLAASLYYAWRFPSAIELLIFAALLDGYYGLALDWSLPWYSVAAGALLAAVEWLRSLVSRYNVSDL